ncbi:MAG: PPOX class F420-dependent oxidoreductase [Ignavibacteriales bacterium]
MTEMSKREIKRFLIQGTLTGKLATVKKDNSPHIVPVWFVLDEIHKRRGGRGIGDIVFMTGIDSLKAKNIQRNNKISFCVDDQTPLFSFVTVFGIARIYHYNQTKLFKWATRIAERYMGKDMAEAYGKRNSREDEIVIRVEPTRILAEKDIAN